MNQKNQIDSPKWGGPHNLLIFHSFFAAICGSCIFISTFTTFVEGKGLFQTGLSGGKLFFLLVILLLVLFFYAAAFYLLLKPGQAQKFGKLFFEKSSTGSAGWWINGIGFVLCWIGFFVSTHLVFDGIQGYFLLIKPILLWGCLFFISQIVIIHLGSGGQLFTSIFSSRNSLYRPALVVLFVFLLIFIFVVNTGIGISVREDYWYGVGVPLLWSQLGTSVLAAILISLAFKHIKVLRDAPRIDLLIFILIWLLAAILWAGQPLRSSHFMPDPGINPIYPYSDSALFDIGSQFALIGQGLFNDQYFDRSLYSVFLTYLHLFVGQNTADLMAVQAVVFAVFPAILYLIGKELYGRVLGFSFAIAMMFRGINSISGSSLIDTAGPKMMLTDFPAAIGVALLVLLILKWMNDSWKISNIIWAGCAIGLTLLLRSNVIFLLPFILLYFLLFYRTRRKLWFYTSLLLVAGMFASTLPIEIKNTRKGVPLFYVYYSRIQEVLHTRYGISEKSPDDAGNRQRVSMSHRYRMAEYELNTITKCETKICNIGNHFFHNLATSMLSLPASFELHDLHYVVKSSAPYWRQDWVGEGLSGENYLLLFINLAVVSIGVGAAWNHSRLVGLFPLAVLILYLLSNTLALTSGGRYIVPVDWIIWLYYFIGMLKLIFWALQQMNFDLQLYYVPEIIGSSAQPLAVSFQGLAGNLLLILMIGSLLPLVDVIFPRRYQEKTANDIVVTLVESGLLKEARLTPEILSGYINDPNVRITIGRLLYPRFYPSNKGENGLDYPYLALNYRRLVFVVAGPLTQPFGDNIILPMEKFKHELHAVDVAVLGCATEEFLDALVVFILSEPKQVFVRPSGLTLQCPLPSPQ